MRQSCSQIFAVYLSRRQHHPLKRAQQFAKSNKGFAFAHTSSRQGYFYCIETAFLSICFGLTRELYAATVGVMQCKFGKLVSKVEPDEYKLDSAHTHN